MDGINGQALPSGICFQHIKALSNVSKLSIWFSCGSREEKDGEYGIVHLAEHCIYYIIKEKMINTSASVSAQISYDYTLLEITVLNEEIDKVIKILSECFLNPIISTEVIQMEKKRIGEEYIARSVNKDYMMTDLLYESIWNNQLNHSPMGKLELINGFELIRVQSIIRKILCSRMVIVYMGGIEYYQMISILSSAKLQEFTQEESNIVAEFKDVNQDIIMGKEKKVEHLNLVFVPSEKIKGSDYAKFVFWSTALAGHPRAILPEKICFQNPLSYYVKSETINHRLESMLKISAIINNDKLTEVEKHIKEAVYNVKLIDEKQFKQIKVIMDSYMQEMLNSSSSLMRFIGNILIINSNLESNEALDVIVNCAQRISLDDIYDFHNRNIVNYKVSTVNFKG